MGDGPLPVNQLRQSKKGLVDGDGKNLIWVEKGYRVKAGGCSSVWVEAWYAAQVTVSLEEMDTSSNFRRECSTQVTSVCFSVAIQLTDSVITHTGTTALLGSSSTGWTVAYSFGSTCPVPLGGRVTGSLSSPGLLVIGNWNTLIPVPWNEETAVVEDGLWSMFFEELL